MSTNKAAVAPVMKERYGKAPISLPNRRAVGIGDAYRRRRKPKRRSR